MKFNKIFYITSNSESLAKLKSIPNLTFNFEIEKVEPVDTKYNLSALENHDLSLDVVGLVNKIYFSQYRAFIGQYITHYNIYKKIVDEDLDFALVIQDDIIISELLWLNEQHFKFNEGTDFVNFSNEGLDRLNAYLITNQGARKIFKLLNDVSWMNSVKRFHPTDFWYNEESCEYEVFAKEGAQDFNKQYAICAPINKIIDTARGFSLINTQSNEWLACNPNYNTFANHQTTSFQDFASMNEEELNEYLRSDEFLFEKKKKIYPKLSTDFIFYINRDKDIHKMKRMEKMIEDINLPQERFSAICPTPEDIAPTGKFHSFYKKSKIIEARKYFGEPLNNIDLDRYELGTLGCYLSHYFLLRRAYALKDRAESVIIMEDDCQLNAESLEEINNTLEKLPDDWDILRSTWSASDSLKKINFSHPLLSEFSQSMYQNCLKDIRDLSQRRPLICPVIHSFCGGTHFQIIKVQSIPKIMHYLQSHPIIPIDSMYVTNKLNVYDRKMKISDDIFKESSISKQ